MRGSADATKERIKEIKIVEDINIEKLVRNENNIVKLASTSFSGFTRNTDVSARSLETERTTNTENKEQENVSKEEEKTQTVKKTSKTKSTSSKKEKSSKSTGTGSIKVLVKIWT